MKKEIRVVNQKTKLVQITTFDERWYAKDMENQGTGLPGYVFVPSVTWIAGYYPKGIAFYKWLADKGWDEAEALKSAAGDKGSKIHLAIADLIDGKVIPMDAKYLNKSSGEQEELTVQEYEALMSFKEWYEEGEYEIVKNEYVVWGDGYAGTVDIKARRKSDGKLGIIDVKSGLNVWPEYELQVSAYRKADPETEWQAILQVGYTRNKTKKFKFTEVEDKFPLFLAAKQIWSNECEGVMPMQKDYPLTIQIVKPVSVDPEKKEDKKTIKKTIKK